LNLETHKIALFGTSADPPTNGHEIIIRELAKKYSLVITYASNNPSKNHQEDLFNRSLLLKTLIEEIDNSKIIFDEEISSPWAINTIETCKAKYEINALDFVIGSDLLEEMFSWKNINEILNEANLYIIPREGYPLNTKYLDQIKHLKGIFEVASFKIPKISSSMIRLNLNYSLLPKSLISIIKSKNLYKGNKIEE
tara:strand:+ start:6638 stop:7225 length:588 start_codon:yes stop_codon:yes gene_type:complete